jgi:hypothetical protein
MARCSVPPTNATLVTERLLRYAALAGALALPFVLLAVIVHFAVEVPYWDEWEWAELIYRSRTGTLTFGDLWAQHNEHRIFLDHLIALGLDRLGGWSVVREQMFSAVTVVLTQLVLWRIVRRTVVPEIAPFALLGGSLFLYDLVQYENFSWGFQMAWFVCDLAAVTVAWLLSDDPEEARPLLLAVVPATLASLASSQGLIAWPVGALALIFARRGLPTLLAWCACGITVGAVIRAGVVPTASGHVSLLHNLPSVVKFIVIYLGAPLGRAGGLAACEVVGAAALVLLAAAFADDLRAPDRAERLARRAPWYAIAAYAILGAALTAPARLGFGIEEAVAGRYSSIATFLYVGLVGLGATFLAGVSLRRAIAPAAALVLVVAVGGVSLVGYGGWKTYARARRADITALRRGDAAAAHDLYPAADRRATFEDEMRTLRDGVFHR